MRVKSLFLSWDFLMSLTVTGIVYFILPQRLFLNVEKDMASIAIPVLSIIFAVFFAALAIILSSGDDDFIIFLEEENNYSIIVWTFKFTLSIIFAALIFSIVYYASISFLLAQGEELHSKYCFTVFTFVFCYSLLCSFNACFDAITYSGFRAKFVNLTKRKK